jgi:hypothetical protein
MKISLDQSIPPQRLVVYSTLFLVLLVVGVILWTQNAISTAETNRELLLSIGDQIRTKAEHQEQNRLIICRFSNKDPLYLHKHLETMPLLSQEVEMGRAHLTKSALPEDVLIDRRVQLLTSGENNFSFIEGPLELGAAYKETIEQQSKPVEVSNEDLITILSHLEESRDDTPHLIISEAKLERKKGVLQEVWGINLKVIRREYTE